MALKNFISPVRSQDSTRAVSKFKGSLTKADSKLYSHVTRKSAVSTSIKYKNTIFIKYIYTVFCIIVKIVLILNSNSDLSNHDAYFSLHVPFIYLFNYLFIHSFNFIILYVGKVNTKIPYMSIALISKINHSNFMIESHSLK